jgi:hypothetical protein
MSPGRALRASIRRSITVSPTISVGSIDPDRTAKLFRPMKPGATTNVPNTTEKPKAHQRTSRTHVPAIRTGSGRRREGASAIALTCSVPPT